MSRPGLDPELAAVLQVLEHELGPLEVLEVYPTPPGRRPAPPPAPGPEPAQPSLFDPTPELEPAPTSATDPFSYLPPHRRWLEALRHARPFSPATPSTWRSL